MADGEMRREREAWVATTATVTGDVLLGPDTSVWFGCSVRGDEASIRVGARTNLQENCVAHTDPGLPLSIGEDVTVGHGAILHGSRIGSGSLVGMGAILLQKSVIGEECLVGAGSLVPEGMEVPRRSVVLGVPGKVVRQVTDAEAKRFREQARGYVEKATAHCGKRYSRLI